MENQKASKMRYPEYRGYSIEQTLAAIRAERKKDWDDIDGDKIDYLKNRLTRLRREERKKAV